MWLDGIRPIKGSLRGASAPLLLSPPPLIREGDKGGRLPHKKLKRVRLINNLNNPAGRPGCWPRQEIKDRLDKD